MIMMMKKEVAISKIDLKPGQDSTIGSLNLVQKQRHTYLLFL